MADEKVKPVLEDNKMEPTIADEKIGHGTGDSSSENENGYPEEHVNLNSNIEAR